MCFGLRAKAYDKLNSWHICKASGVRLSISATPLPTLCSVGSALASNIEYYIRVLSAKVINAYMTPTIAQKPVIKKKSFYCLFN